MAGTKLPESREDQDSAYNPGELHAAEQFPESYTSAGLDQLESFANDPANSTKKESGSNPSANIENVQEAERQKQETPWDNKTTPGGGNEQKKGFRGFIGRLAGGAKKKGPIIIILGVLGIGGGAALIPPALAPFQPNIGARNWYDTTSRAAPVHWSNALKNLIGNQKACEGKPTGIRCKLATVTDNTIEKAKEQKFQVETIPIKDANGKPTDRHMITSMTFPDGYKATSGDALLAHMNANVGMASRVYAFSNPRSLALVGRNISIKVLQKFGIAKNKIVLSGKNQQELSRSFAKEAGLPDDPKADANEKTSKTKETIDAEGSKVSGKIGKAGNVAAAVCGGYDLTRGALTAIKIANALKYVAFGWQFFKLYDQIRAGDADAVTISAIATALTRTVASGPNKGKSALDSPGFKAMMYGDRPTLTSGMQKILLGGNPALVDLDGLLVKVKQLFGARTLHGGCKTVNDPALGALLTLALCGASGAAGGTVIPILGNVIGGAGGVVACTIINTGIGLLSGVVVNKIIEQLMPGITSYFENTNLNLNMDPIDMGNAITIAGGLLFGSVGLANGMQLGTKSQVQDFNKLTYETDRQYEEIARYDARSTPFDTTNEYSFMGQLVTKFGLADTSSNPFTRALSSMGSIFSQAPLALVPNSFAADMPSPMKENSLGKCQDPELDSKGLSCDALGQPITVQSAADMNRSTEDTLNYMIGNGYVDEDGNVNPDKDYSKFVKYCTGQEQAIPGTTTLSIDDDDYIWPETKCYQDDEMMSNFRTYTFRVAQKDDEDTAYTAEAANAGNGSGGTSGGNTSGGTTTPGADIVGDDYKAECSKYAFCSKQCVDFVLFRLVKHGVLPGKQKLGNGKDVVTTLGGLGFKVDTTPAVHAVMSTSHTSHPNLGHTAIVSQVNADGSIVVEEYNYTHSIQYDTRTITAQQIKDDGITFAHTETAYK